MSAPTDGFVDLTRPDVKDYFTYMSRYNVILDIMLSAKG